MTDRPVLKVWLDFVCPFCLLSEGPLAEAMEGLDLAVEYMPFELREEPTPALRPEDDYLPSIWASSVYPRAARLGVPIRLPTISPQPYTRLAFEGLQYARAHDREHAYVVAVLRAFFQQDRDIGDVAVLTDVAISLGLSGHDFDHALQSGAYAQAHRAALDIARVEAIRSVPTFQLGPTRFEHVPSVTQLRAAMANSPIDQEGPRPLGS